MPCGKRATIEAKIISEMPLPMPRWVISSPIHISSTVPAVSETTIRKTCGVSKCGMTGAPTPWPKLLEEEDVADRLSKGQADGEVARVLRDPRLADLALLRQLLQRRHHDRQQLQDDRGRDVGHDPQREQRDPRQPAAAERVQQVEDPAAAEVLLDVVDRLRIDPRHRDVRSQPVERQKRRREGELLTDIGDREGAEDRRQHRPIEVTRRACRCRRPPRSPGARRR